MSINDMFKEYKKHINQLIITMLPNKGIIDINENWDGWRQEYEYNPKIEKELIFQSTVWIKTRLDENRYPDQKTFHNIKKSLINEIAKYLAEYRVKDKNTDQLKQARKDIKKILLLQTNNITNSIYKIQNSYQKNIPTRKKYINMY